MSDNMVKQHIKNLFIEMNDEVRQIVKVSTSADSATQEVMEYVSSSIAAASRGYMADLYSIFSKKTLNDPAFQDSANANKFYDLNMRQQIANAYQFDIKDLKTYCDGVNYKEINRLYASAGVAVGSATVSGILLGALSGMVKIPMVIVIAGAVLVGLTGGGITYAKVVPEQNKTRFINAVMQFMSELEAEMLTWVDSVEAFYDEQINTLKKNL